MREGQKVLEYARRILAERDGLHQEPKALTAGLTALPAAGLFSSRQVSSASTVNSRSRESGTMAPPKAQEPSTKNSHILPRRQTLSTMPHALSGLVSRDRRRMNPESNTMPRVRGAAE